MADNFNKQLVSIIIPVYNTEKYLEKAINSTINQKYKNIEIIIIDDASTDNSATIIEKYKRIDNRIFAIKHKENKGLSISRNDGLKHASGDYICFLDSDDYISDDLVEECLKKCQELQLDLLMYDATSFMDDGMKESSIRVCNYDRSKIIKNLRCTDGYSFVTKYAHCDGVVLSSCLMFINRKFLVNNAILFMEGVYYEDNKFHFDCMIKAKKISYISKKFYNRRYREGSIITSELCKANFISAFEISNGMVDTFLNEISKDDGCKWLWYLILRIKSCIRQVFGQINSKNVAEYMDYYDVIIDMHCELVEKILDIFYICKISQDNELFTELYELTYYIVSAFDYLPDAIIELIERIRCYQYYYIYKTVNDLNLLGREDVRVGIYGTGEYAEYIYNSYIREGGCIKADVFFIRSRCVSYRDTFWGKRVVCIDDIEIEKPDAIIVMSTKYNNEMMAEAKGKFSGPVYSVLSLMGSAMDINGNKEVLDWPMRLYSISDISLKKHVSRIVLMNTPEHNNIGDYLIAENIKRLVGEYMPDKEVISFSQDKIERDWLNVCSQVRLNDIIIVNGGGSLGILWNSGKTIVKVLERFRKNKIVIFPQTMYFADNVDKDGWILRYQNVIKSCVDLSICLREQISYNMAKEIFDTCVKIYLFPDVALMMEPQIFRNERNGAIFALRNDIEGIISEDDKKRAKKVLTEEFKSVRQGSMRYERKMFTKAGKAIIKRRLSEVSKAELVITDALHMVIACALTGTPCIAVDNLTGKVGGVFEWIKTLEYISFFKNMDEVLRFDIKNWSVLNRQWQYSLDFSNQEEDLMRLVKGN